MCRNSSNQQDLPVRSGCGRRNTVNSIHSVTYLAASSLRTSNSANSTSRLASLATLQQPGGCSVKPTNSWCKIKKGRRRSDDEWILKVRWHWTRSNQNLTSWIPRKRFQPVANFASGCLTSIRQNCFWIAGSIWESDVSDHSWKLPIFASHLSYNRLHRH